MADYRSKPGTLTDIHTIRAYEVGPSGSAGIGNLANIMQETAGHHANALGFSMERLMQQNLAWVLTRLRVQVSRYPTGGEEVHLVTWPSALDRAAATRDYCLYDSAGKEFARATSGWVCFNVSTRQMVPFPPFIDEGYPDLHPDPIIRFETRTLPRLREPRHQTRVIARRSDLDINGHVNNVHFLEWAVEAVPDLEEGMLAELDIQFRSECFAGDEVESRCGETEGEGGKRFQHSLVRLADGAELARAVSLWK